MALGTPVAGAAAYSAAGGTTVAPAYPSGITAGDALVMFVGMKPSTANSGSVTTPTGWTLQDSLTGAGGYGTTLGADTGNTNLWVFTKDTVTGSETGTLSVTLGTNNVAWAFIVRVPTGGGALSYGSADGQRTTTPTSPMSIALTNGATATDFQAGDKAIWAMCIPTDVTTPSQFSAQSITATGATFSTAVELNEPDSTTGNDIGGYSAYAHVDSGSSTTAPTVTATLAGTLTNVRGPVVLVRIREAPVAQTLTPDPYTNDQTFYGPTVIQQQFLTPALYTNSQVFYDPSVAQGGGTQALTPALYANSQTFHSATVGSSYVLIPSQYANAQSFYSATVSTSYSLAPSLYSSAESFYSATVSQVAAGQVLSPSLYTNDQAFFSVTVSTSNTLSMPEWVESGWVDPGWVGWPYFNTPTFYAPRVALLQTLQPALFNNTGSGGGDVPYVLKYWDGSAWQILYKDPVVY